MREFNDIGAFLRHMAGNMVKVEAAIERGLERAAKIVERQAKAEIGHYQTGEGPFHDWPELSEYTQNDRKALGFTPNDPGLRTGEMEESIGHIVQGHTATVGSADEHLLWFELGTKTQPPRSVLGLAAVKRTHEAAHAVAAPVARALGATIIDEPGE